MSILASHTILILYCLALCGRLSPCSKQSEQISHEMPIAHILTRTIIRTLICRVVDLINKFKYVERSFCTCSAHVRTLHNVTRRHRTNEWPPKKKGSKINSMTNCQAHSTPFIFVHMSNEPSNNCPDIRIYLFTYPTRF